MSTINIDFRLDGTLVTVDTTINIVISRCDTEQDFVSSIAMTEVTKGKYIHTFTDPGNDLKYAYTVSIVHATVSTTIIGNKYGPVVKSYRNRDDAQVYFDDHLNSEPWNCATEPQQVKALIEGTRRIDRLAIAGVKNKEAQLLKFPRGSDTVVPVAIHEACYEIALAILDEVEDEDRSVTSRSFGGIRTTYDVSVNQPWLTAGILSKEAWIMLLPYLSKTREIKLNRES